MIVDLPLRSVPGTEPVSDTLWYSSCLFSLRRKIAVVTGGRVEGIERRDPSCSSPAEVRQVVLSTSTQVC